MKYKITIEKLYDKQVKEKNWVKVEPYKDEEGKTKTHDYRIEETTQDIIEEIYSQVREGELPLKKVIDAFNE